MQKSYNEILSENAMIFGSYGLSQDEYFLGEFIWINYYYFSNGIYYDNLMLLD